MKSLLVCLVVVLLACTGAAQTLSFVSPLAYTSVEGPNSNNYPFFYPFPAFSYMQIHDDLPRRVMRISAIAFRRDARAGGSNIVPAWTANLSLSMSTAVTASGAASSTFASNHGPDLTTVRPAGIVNFPASDGGPMPKKFVNRIVLTKPFIFANNPVANKSLCYEIRITANSLVSGQYSLHDSVSTNPNYSSTKIGTGGTAVGQTKPSYCSCFAAYDGMLRLYVFQYLTGITAAPISNKPFMWIGLSASKWGPVNLPFDLASLGGKGNMLYTNMMLFFVGKGMTDVNGGYNWYSEAVRVPNDPILSPLTYYMQTASTDVKNPIFPFVFTHATRMTIPITPAQPVSRIYNSGSATAKTGGYQAGNGLVTLFEYL